MVQGAFFKVFRHIGQRSSEAEAMFSTCYSGLGSTWCVAGFVTLMFVLVPFGKRVENPWSSTVWQNRFVSLQH